MTPPLGARASILTRLQLGLEALYRVETQLSIDAFVIDAAARAAVGPARSPREQLLIRQEDDDELGLGLFIDASALDNLERNDPGAGLDDRNFSDFCLALEGVSHFVYVALAAARSRPISQLELELQAEVDKFACCVLLAGPSRTLRTRLYGDVRFADDLDGEELSRYQTANAEANRYATALERRYATPDRTAGLLGELRQFYRMALADKLGHIARLA